MPLPWTPDQLQAIGGARELEITTARPDGTLRQWVPIWVVTATLRPSPSSPAS